MDAQSRTHTDPDEWQPVLNQAAELERQVDRWIAEFDDLPAGCDCPECLGDGYYGRTPAVRAICDRCQDTRALLWVDRHDSSEPLRVAPRETSPVNVADSPQAGESPHHRLKSVGHVDVAEGVDIDERVTITCRSATCRGSRGGRRMFRPLLGDLWTAHAEAAFQGCDVILHGSNRVTVRSKSKGLAVPTIAGPAR